MGQHHRHATVLGIQTGEHMQHKGIITFGSRRHTPIETVVLIQFGGHFLLALAVRFGLREEAAVPLVQTEGWICHHHLELH